MFQKPVFLGKDFLPGQGHYLFKCFDRDLAMSEHCQIFFLNRLWKSFSKKFAKFFQTFSICFGIKNDSHVVRLSSPFLFCQVPEVEGEPPAPPGVTPAVLSGSLNANAALLILDKSDLYVP